MGANGGKRAEDRHSAQEIPRLLQKQARRNRCAGGTEIFLNHGTNLTVDQTGPITFAGHFDAGTASLTKNGVSSVFESRAPTGTAGSDWDLINVSGGSLDLSSLTAGGYTLQLVSLDGSNTQGAPISGLTGPTSWTIFQSTSLTGFNPNLFSFDTSQFYGSGFFSVSQSGNNLLLNFTPVPEPSTYALMALGLGLVGLAAWRKSRRT